MNIQFFICFHKKIHHEIYKVTEEEKKYITLYGVREKDPLNLTNIIYEYELAQYNPTLQKNHYKEGSSIYHVYLNKLYTQYDYVGFGQYDMIFPESTFKSIEKNLSEHTIFYIDFFRWAFVGGQTAITTDYYNVEGGLKNYNRFFKTNYTEEDLIRNRMIVCNTFLIPKKMFEKMMSWLIFYFVDDIHHCMYDTTNNNKPFSPGHMIEALTGMFLALEGARYVKLDIEHSDQHRLSA